MSTNNASDLEVHKMWENMPYDHDPVLVIDDWLGMCILEKASASPVAKLTI